MPLLRMLKKYSYISVLVIVLVLVFTAFINKKIIVTQLNDWQLLPQPERFTELYFEDHLNLPQSVIAGEEMEFKVIVHNLEYRRFEYDYEVTVDKPKTATRVNTDNFSLDHDKYKIISMRFPLELDESTTSAKTKVEVKLLNKNQSIHFWTNVVQP